MWKNFETTDRQLKELLSKLLRHFGIYYELSQCYTGWHFEIKCDSNQTDIINNWLDGYFAEQEVY